jgi:hypothetical protein
MSGSRSTRAVLAICGAVALTLYLWAPVFAQGSQKSGRTGSTSVSCAQQPNTCGSYSSAGSTGAQSNAASKSGVQKNQYRSTRSNNGYWTESRSSARTHESHHTSGNVEIFGAWR